jgi:hypothetical protein
VCMKEVKMGSFRIYSLRFSSKFLSFMAVLLRWFLPKVLLGFLLHSLKVPVG